jgi:hypothetical protein
MYVRMNNLTDAELLCRSRRSARAFRALYDRHAEAVNRFLLRRTRDENAAFELTAETFARRLALAEPVRGPRERKRGSVAVRDRAQRAGAIGPPAVARASGARAPRRRAARGARVGRRRREVARGARRRPGGRARVARARRAPGCTGTATSARDPASAGSSARISSGSTRPSPATASRTSSRTARRRRPAASPRRRPSGRRGAWSASPPEACRAC